MNRITLSASAVPHGLRGAWNRLADALTGVINHASLALADRIAIAAIFWLSGRTKVEGILTVTDGAYTLFREEYKVPLLRPEIAAHMAAYAEHLFPILLVLGLCTRLSALALLGMTAVIQIFVYPDAYGVHGTWGTCLLFIMKYGPGPISLDHFIARAMR